jgi:NNP family nitrate/nitrite transporter-like MFS transporter
MAITALKVLFASPEINPANRKAVSIPVLNPFDKYGRVFFFSWMGFMVAFLSWYAFPPLVSYAILAPSISNRDWPANPIL